ncbi:phosphoribosylglycinamide formyltransferase [Marinococcus luteus]|nr:phosphoribosylglycinamide formyltransferase [Marinococcus luteus]
MMKLALFASGTGSNARSLVRAAREQRLEAEFVLIVCDRPRAPVLAFAEEEGIPVFAFSPKEYENKAAFETEIVKELYAKGVERIVLAGYMRLIGDTLLTEYGGRMINVHPSLLPAFPGKDAIRQAWDAGVKVTGVTVHYVDEGMDTGSIIAQEPLYVKETDSFETLTAGIQAVEHRLYPEIVQQWIARPLKTVQTNTEGANHS